MEHSETVYGIASVSKLFGGTLAAKLEAEGALRNGTAISLDMDDPTSEYLTTIPSHHTHEVEELTAHLGCVAHYTTTPSIPNQTTHYSTAQAAAESIWDTRLVNGCSVGSQVRYSTPAFTLLGAVLEDVSGVPLDRLLENELFDRYGLNDTRVQFETARLPSNYDRAVPYTDPTPNPTTYGDNSWKILGGGIESTAVDMARLGWLTMNAQIVSADKRDNRLFTPVDESCTGPGGGTCRYGVAWDLGTDSSRRIAEHGGSWTGSRAWLRVYPDDGLVISVLSNQDNHNPANLVNDIADTVLAP